MRISATQCLAAFALGFVAVACSSPPLGLDPAQDAGTGVPIGSAGSSVATQAPVTQGTGGAVTTGTGAGAGNAAPVSVQVPTGTGGTSVTTTATIPEQGAGGVLGIPITPDAGTDVIPDPASDAGGIIQATTDAGELPDAGGSVEPPKGDGGERSVRSCVPTNCGTHSWACWRMPNTANSGLPNPANYTDMGDGTIRDNQTCLLWQKQAYTVGYSWADAKAKCSQSPLLEGTGWRLPTRIELISIIDFSRTDPSIVVSVFPSTQPNPPFWTWSPFPGAANNSYIVSFHEGAVSTAEQSAYFMARCVRGNGEDPNLPVVAPANHYQIGVDEVTDQYTGLVWQRLDSQTLSPNGLSAQDAASYCASLPVAAGKDHWRMPSVKELATLVDESRIVQGLAAVDLAAFPSTVAANYWSATHVGAQHWTVSFKDGTMSYAATAGFVRCVR